MKTPEPIEVFEDEEVKRHVLDEMRKRLKMDEVRTGVHVSDLIYCVRKAWKLQQLDKEPGGRAAFIERTPDETVMVWVIGHSHEAIFGGKHVKGQMIEVDGIQCTPDFWTDWNEQAVLTEMKSTRKSAKSGILDMPHYLAQVASYCAAHGLTEALIFVFHLMGDYDRSKPVSAIFRVWRVRFEKRDLKAWWAELKWRRAVVLDAMDPWNSCGCGAVMPVYDWECGFCKVREMLKCPGSMEFQQAELKRLGKKQITEL